MSIRTIKETKPITAPHRKILPYISIREPRNNNAYHSIVENLPMLIEDPKMNNILKTPKFIEYKK